MHFQEEGGGDIEAGTMDIHGVPVAATRWYVLAAPHRDGPWTVISGPLSLGSAQELVDRLERIQAGVAPADVRRIMDSEWRPDRNPLRESVDRLTQAELELSRALDALTGRDTNPLVDDRVRDPLAFHLASHIEGARIVVHGLSRAYRTEIEARERLDRDS